MVQVSCQIITGSGVMTIFIYKGLTRNPEIGNASVRVSPISEDWGKLGIPDLAQITNVSDKKLLNAGKYQGYYYGKTNRIGVGNDCQL